MAPIYQITWQWTGFPGSPGYTTLFFDGATDSPTGALAAATKSRLLFAGITGGLQSNTTIGLVTDVRVLEDTSGDVLSIYTVSGIASVTGSGGEAYAGPVGSCVDWITTTLHEGRRMQGRTFVVPCNSAVYDTNGSLSGSWITTLATAAEAMRTASGPAFGVWGRPRKAQVAPLPPKPAVDGLWGPAVSSRIPDKAVVLRSRRA
jgi:hypothetical protein